MKNSRTAKLGLILIGGLFSAFLLAYHIVDNRAATTCRRAMYEVKCGRPQMACESVSWLLWFQPDHPEALYANGLGLQHQKQYTAATRMFRKVRETEALFSAAQMQLIASLLADYRMEEAEVVLQRCVKKLPGSTSVRLQLSGLLIAQGRQLEAVKVLNSYLMMPTWANLTLENKLQLLRELARIQFDPPPTSAFIQMLQQSLEKYPDQASVRIAVAASQLNSGNSDLAVHSLQAGSLASRLRTVPHHLNAIAVLLDLAELPQANATLSKAQEAAARESIDLKRNGLYWNIRSRISELNNDLPSALTFAKNALNLKPDDKTRHARLARIFQQLGRKEDAKLAYTESHRLATADLKLWQLTRTLRLVPTTKQCEDVAALYESRGNLSCAERGETSQL